MHVMGDFVYNTSTKVLRCHKPIVLGDKEDIINHFRNKVFTGLLKITLTSILFGAVLY